ncbi:MAG TPA: fibronectin type III domain-containing protein, partial [Terriglobales bacterium]|nr:fibronectin type III domain-containing protein [Terriglobales bacterium]
MRTIFVCLLAAAGLGAQTLAPTVSQVTSASFTLSWTTSQSLNTQVHYGIGAASGLAAVWKLTTSHSATVAGLQPG